MNGGSKTDRIIDWLAYGQTGSSSKTLAFYALGRTGVRIAWPHDPGDLRRCLLLIKEVPEIRKETIPALAGVSPEWKALSEVWEELKSALQEETGPGLELGGSAPITYRLIKETGAKAGLRL